MRRSFALSVVVLLGCGGGAGGASPSSAADADVGHDVAVQDTSFTADGSGDADAAIDATPSSPAFGANVDATGVSFRVWAPHATGARVVGDFPEASTPMASEPGGVFSTHVASAHAGTHYHYELDSPLGVISRMDPWCRELASDGACVVVDPAAFAWKSSGFVRPTRTASIVYELHVGSFVADAGVGHGTFASTQTRLGALSDLGVNVVELMPVHDSGGSALGWGYNPQLWLAPKPSLGTSSDLRALVDAAHGVGVGVWIDVVMNHADNFAKAPLVCFDGACDTSPKGVYFFPPGTYATTPWGPRPDYAEPRVAEMLVGSIAQWLEEYRGDGFRWDSVSNIRAIDGSGTTPGGKELLVAANEKTHALGGTSVAEDLKGYDAVTAPSSAGGFDFDAQWDGFGYAVDGVLSASSDDARDLGAVQGALTGSYGGDPFARVLFLEDHDIVGNGGARLPAKIDPTDPESWTARKLTMAGAVLLFTAPGVPMIFMGEEQLATAPFDNHAPTPIPPPTAAGAKISVFFRDMMRLRRNLDGGTGGLLDANVEILQRNDAAKVIAYRRHGGSGEDVVVVVNLRNKAYVEYDVGVGDPGPWRIRLNTDHVAYGDDFVEGEGGSVTAKTTTKDGKPYALPLQLGAYDAIVLSK